MTARQNQPKVGERRQISRNFFMSINNKLAKLLRVSGSVYFLLNFVILIVICILAINAMIKTSMSPGFMVLILPLIGILEINWRKEREGDEGELDRKEIQIAGGLRSASLDRSYPVR
jgi:hypothetical protein